MTTTHDVATEHARLAAEHARLADALRDFRFDPDNARVLFHERLARENGWSRPYARRVVEEYKRFLFLAGVAGHIVTPSEHVDQAWHLHLVYTRSYWNDLCENVLRRPLHHTPGTGAETVDFRACYEHTLTSYRAFFGVDPPRDIWPDRKRRFGADLDHRRVWRATHVVIPKIVVVAAAVLVACAAALIAAWWCA